MTGVFWGLGSGQLALCPLSRLQPISLWPGGLSLPACSRGAQGQFQTLGLAWVVEERASLCSCAPASAVEASARAAACPTCSACVPAPFQASLLSRPPGSGPVLVSPQTGCLWSWSAWRSSSSSSCWASAGVSAAPTPAAVTSGAPAARTNAAAQRPVSALRVSPPPLPQASLLDPRRGGGRLPASRGSATHLAEQLGGKGPGRTGSFGLSSIYSSFSLIFPFYLFWGFPFESIIMHVV